MSFSQPRSRNAFLQRNAMNEFHDQHRQAGDFVDRVNGDDVIVADGGRCLGLASKTLAGVAAGRQGWMQNLDRHKAIEFLVVPFEHDAEAAFAENRQDFVGAQPAEMFGVLRRFEKVKGDRFVRDVVGAKAVGHRGYFELLHRLLQNFVFVGRQVGNRRFLRNALGRFGVECRPAEFTGVQMRGNLCFVFGGQLAREHLKPAWRFRACRGAGHNCSPISAEIT